LVFQVICLDYNDEGNRVTGRLMQQAKLRAEFSLIHCDVSSEEEVSGAPFSQTKDDILKRICL
jgi:hypothetical protein